MRVWISRVLYGASNHIISLTKKGFSKKISICQKWLSTIFALLQKNACLGERKKLHKMKVVFWTHLVELYPLGISLANFEGNMNSPW